MTRRDLAAREAVDALRASLEFSSRYRIGNEIGAGRYTRVYEGVQFCVGRPVAIKLLLSHDNLTNVERFRREGRFLASLSHPNIVRLFDVDLVQSHPYLVMELLNGGSLRDELGRRQRLPWKRAVRLTLDSLAGLEVCHQANLIHRDIKPENILLHPDGYGKLADFGLSRLAEGGRSITGKGVRIGTPLYMAPEVVRGFPAIPASDVYALALILYEMMTGQHPFPCADEETLLRLHLKANPRPIHRSAPDIPPGLVRVLSTALEKDPLDRFPDASAFRAQLQPFDPTWEKLERETQQTVAREQSISKCQTDVDQMQPKRRTRLLGGLSGLRRLISAIRMRSHLLCLLAGFALGYFYGLR